MAHFGAMDVPEADQTIGLKPVRHISMCDLEPKMLEMKYAVRGAVASKAELVSQMLAAGEKLPFDRIVPCNIGNPHAVHQKPITFYRQVAACVLCPSILDFQGENSMPLDVVERAREYLAGTGQNGVGAYTHSNGLIMVRRQIANFIEERDGFPCDVNHLALTTGASEGVKRCISALVQPGDGLMAPCPQYPLYSAALAMCGGQIVFYNLNEERNWGVSREELDRSHQEATAKGIRVVSIAVINPGNPSGAVLDRSEVEMMVTFARDKKVVILADEVYQENVYKEGKSFHSFKKVLRELQVDQTYSEVQLVSFHSTSKGLIGECGQRGGYAEFIGFSDRTMEQFTKVAATSLSCNTLGQVFCGLMVTPPSEDGPSFPLFKEETDSIYNGLRRRAKMLQDGLNSIEGISCQDIEGAMYGFPQLTVPKRAEAEAEAKGMPADEYWCLRLVDEAGIVCVPGSGFGQQEGTYHFRITILPPDDMLQDCIERIRKFHDNFTKEFA